MKKLSATHTLLLTLLSLGFSAPSMGQIYNVGSDDGFSFSCAGSPGNEIFLPVSSYRFEAHCVPRGIRIFWSFPESTTGQITQPERSFDGKIFYPCHGIVQPLQNGFELIDYLPEYATRYYRLNIQTPNQPPVYSRVIASVCHRNQSLISPNPSNGIFSIYSVEPNSSISITDVAGKQVLTTTLLNHSERINASHLRAGIYNVEFLSGEIRLQQRIIITH